MTEKEIQTLEGVVLQGKREIEAIRPLKRDLNLIEHGYVKIYIGDILIPHFNTAHQKQIKDLLIIILEAQVAVAQKTLKELKLP